MNNKILDFILDFINLHNGEEKKEKVLETVKSNISFRGSNLWILACAIVIASIGLNVNSTAVIIGAMLISPLMGPIVGIGFALAIYDFSLLKRSAKNLAIATILSLTVACIYFLVSPFKETQSEILARTSPNIYDVLIAFFGGLVGVIALTRVEKGNPIPGVAIATALMPPLCTAGYGIAIGKFSYFIGAFYLYSINCVFICISTFLIIKFLKYEPVSTLNPKYEKQIKYGITVLIFIMIVPSFYMAYNLFQERRFIQKAEQFIENEFIANGYTPIYKNIMYNTKPKKIEIGFLTKQFTTQETEVLTKKLSKYDIENTELKISQETKDLKNQILDELTKQNKMLSTQDSLITKLQSELNSYKFNNTEVMQEIKILFPELKEFSIGRHTQNTKKDSTQSEIVLLYQTKLKNQKIDKDKLYNWLQQKFKTNGIKIVQLQ